MNKKKLFYLVKKKIFHKIKKEKSFIKILIEGLLKLIKIMMKLIRIFL